MILPKIELSLNLSKNKRKLRLKSLLVFVLLLVLNNNTFAQIRVSPGTQSPYTVESLIRDVFQGEGVQITNVTFQGDEEQLGYFDSALNDIGIDQGVALSTGSFADIDKVNDKVDCCAGFILDPPVFDNDLSSMVSGPISDVTIIEIDFIPLGNSITFSYVFASEEYPPYGHDAVLGSYNDPFGLFLSGDGINGPFENNAENLALLPDGITIVSIENVHPINLPANPTGANTAFYNENPTGSHMQFDGYISVLEATSTVTPCTPYKLKIAIADVGGKIAGNPDNVGDSAILLEQSSFSSSAPVSERVTFNQNGIIQEGCSDGSIEVELAEPAVGDYPISFTVGGSAALGVDYNLTSTSAFIVPNGQTTGTLRIVPVVDDMPEGQETITITADITGCTPETFTFILEDNSAVEPVLGDDSTICQGDSVRLYSSFVPIPSGEQSYYSNAQVTIPDVPEGTNIIETVVSSLEVTGAIPDVLGPDVIKSVCLTIRHRSASNLNVFLRAPGGAFIKLTTHNGGGHDGYDNTCFVPDPSAELIALPGVIRDVYDVNASNEIIGTFQPEGDWENLWKNGSSTNGTWELIVFDDIHGPFGFGDFIENFEITFNAPYDIEYNYDSTEGLSCIGCADPWAKPTETTTYQLTVSDNNGCTQTDEITISVIDEVQVVDPICSSSGPNNILVTWDEVPGAIGYDIESAQVLTNPVPTNTNTSHQFNGLDPGQTIDIALTPVVASGSICNVLQTEFQCTVVECDPVILTEESVAPPQCNGGMDGTISVSASSTLGTNFTYSIEGLNKVSSTGIFNGLSSGTYKVIAGISGCFGELMVTVPVQPEIQTTTNLISDPLCAGQASARGTVDATGGTGTYIYEWTNGSDTRGISNVTEGKYYVTVSDGNGCPAIDSLTFIDPEPMQISAASTQVSCNGAMDGTATLTVIEGVRPYNYTWPNGEASLTDSFAINLSGGSYTVIVRDANDCPMAANVTVLERDVIQGTVVPIDATCDGIDDGEASLTDVIGGTGVYAYVWNDAAMSTGTVVTGLAVGDAIVTITDGDGCSVTASASVQSPPTMTAMVMTVPVACSGGSDGGATLTISGGTPAYTYAWSDGGAESSSRTNLTSGINTVTVTDANNCKLIEEFDVPSQNPVFIDLDSTVVTCFGGSDGGISLSASGGTGTLSYQWDDLNNSTSPDLSGLTAGIYTVTINDANMCEFVDSIEVTENEKIELITSSTAIDCNGDGDGSASVIISNGIGVDEYSWDDPLSQTTASAINLDGGIYEVKVTYNGICVDSAQVSVLEPDVLALTIDKKDIACQGETNGSATAIVSGGTAPFSYLWNDILQQNRETASSLTAQTYTVSITDANDCQVSEMVEILEPSRLVLANSDSSPVLCSDSPTGSAFVTPDGGVGPYTYAWSDGGASDSLRSDLLPQKYYITITDASACTLVDSFDISNKAPIVLGTDSLHIRCFGDSTGNAMVIPSGGNGGFRSQWDDPMMQSGSQASNLKAGLYTVTVTDALGCSETAEVEVTQNERINISGDVVPVSCYNGTDGFAEASATGGGGGYSYQWNDPMNTMDFTLLNVPRGIYVVSVTDMLGCTDSLQFTVEEPDTLAVTFVVDGLLCFGDDIGSIRADLTGGNGGFNYQWDDPMNQTTQVASGLIEGFYTLSVVDSRGCSLVDTIRLIEPEQLTLQLEATDVLCNGAPTGAINSTVTGGTLNYSYSYSGGSTDADPFGLTAGMYTLTVTDANGCSLVDDIVINEPPAIVIEDMTENIDCFGNQNGAIDITTSGGVGGFTFEWSSGQVDEDILDLPAGTYTLSVTDDNRCVETTTISISSPTEIQKSVNPTHVACFGESTGRAFVNVSGGSTPYNYEWSNGELTQDIDMLPADTYLVTIEDDNGCVALDSITIDQPAEGITAIPMSTDLVCFGDANGVIDLDVTGGTAPYQFQLNGEAIRNNPTFQGLSGGNYDVLVIDQNGCMLPVNDISVFEPEAFLVDLGDNKIIELGVDTVQLTPQISGGQNDLSYEYSGNNLDNLSCTICPSPFIEGQVFTKEYTLTVVDGAGCTAADNVIVIISKDRRVWVPTGFNPQSIHNSRLLTPLGDPNTTVINFQIFDRWGTLIYEEAGFNLGDSNIGWDGTFKGKELEPGVFVWKADVVYFEDGVEETFTGQTYLVK